LKDFEIKVSDETYEKLLEIIDRLAIPPDDTYAQEVTEE